MNPNQIAAQKLREAADALDAVTNSQWEPGTTTKRAEHDALNGDIAKTWPAVTIPPMTVRGLPTPAPVELQAGQVWVEPDSLFPYVTARGMDGAYGAYSLRGGFPWGSGCKTAAVAVHGLTFAAPSVADYYQAELKKRVAELEAELAARKAQVESLARETSTHAAQITKVRRESYAHAALIVSRIADSLPLPVPNGDDDAWFADRAKEYIASAREEAAKAAREERYITVPKYHTSTTCSVYDTQTGRWAVTNVFESEARAEAARLNAEHAKEKP